MSANVIEHGSGKTTRWLRERRIRMAAWIALAEGVLVLVHAIPRWPALAVALVIVAGYLWAGRNARPGVVREGGWILAVSQALVLLIPVFMLIFWTVALVAVAILGAIALFVLFSRR
jgi:hypothetical protein